ncbi:hypothetical protein OAD78_06380 [Candidatus Thioglobus sp.]|nr:hypothetical protein [Candidatus Thioglobus sp.]
MYSFSKYSKKCKLDWFYIANQELTSCINAQDELILEKNRKFNLIIYKTEDGPDKKKVPIAIFASNGISYKANGIIKELDANSGGLYIQRDFLRQSSAIKAFFLQEVVLNYFAKSCHIDFIHFMYPALAAIEKPESSFISNPTRYAHVNNNSMLYMNMEGDFIHNINRIPRQEINKGIRFIEKNILLKDKNEAMIEHFIYLDKCKSQRLSIKPFSRDYFEELLESKFYNFLLCLDKNTLLPIGGFIYSLIGCVGDSIYIAGTVEERKLFVNKALTYLAMQECKLSGAKYFIIGHGYTDGNMQAVTKYHRSISTNEIASYMFRSPISFKARIYTSLLLFRRREKIG